MNFFQRYQYPLYIILFVVICLWPLSFFQFIPKWDSLDQYLPLRYFLSDYIHNNHFPFWNPFQHMGEMPYSDLQSGCWYPIVWILMLFGKYTITSLSIEVVLTFIIAGIGFYRLGKELLENNEKISFLLAICYSMSGFMVGSAQLLTFLIGIAWLPWLVYSFIKLFKTLSFKYSLLSAVFMAFNITGAAPQFSIIASYILFFVILYQLIISKNKKQTIIVISIFLFSLLVLISPFIFSFFDFYSYSLRDGKIPYNSFYLSNSFTIKEWLSFIFPYSTIAETKFFNPTTDLTLRNGYFGIISLIFFVSVLFSSSFKENKWLIILGFFFLILAMGGDTFIYMLIYYLPGFGTFRHASFYKIYFILIALIISGFQLKKIGTKTYNFNKKIPIILFFSFLAIAGVSFYFSDSLAVKTIFFTILKFKEGPYGSISTHIFIESLIFVFLGALFILINKKANTVNTLIIITILDILIHTNIISPRTVINHIGYTKTKSYFNSIPSEIQQLGYLKLKNLDERQGLKSTEGFWRNLSTFNKTVSYVGHNPTQFKNYHNAEMSGKLNLAIENELFYFPKKFYHKNDSILSGYIWGVNDSISVEIEKTKIDSIVIGYNNFHCTINNNSEKPEWLILNQNYHHLWQACLNGVPLRIRKVNDFVMGVKIPAKSEGNIDFYFKSDKTIYSAILSILSYLVIITYFFYSKINSK